MPGRRRQLVMQVNQIGDAVLIALVFWFAHAFRMQLAYWFPVGSEPSGPFGLTFAPIAPFRYYKWLYLIVIPLCPFLLDLNGFYDRPQHVAGRQAFSILVKSVALCAVIVVAAMYFLVIPTVSRGLVALFACFSVIALYLKDLAFQTHMRYLARQGKSAESVILVGTPEKNAEFEKLLADHPDWNLKVTATLDPARESLDKLPGMLHSQPIACVIFSVGQTEFAQVEKAILICEVEGVEAWLVADFVRTSIARASVDDFYGKPVLVFRTTPDTSWQLVFKRGMDILGATVALIIAGPFIMLPIAIAIKLTSPGPVLFRQKRSGLHGGLFTMLKFRSMVSNAEMLRSELEIFNEATGPVFKIKEDPRITPIGRFLRRTSIDELPQFWNVLIGDMSLVGPRPPIPSEVEKYDPWHRRRLSMKPGITCLWQISGRSNIGFDQWMKLDLKYIDNWSIWLDFKILFRTIPVVFAGRGAH